MVFLKLLSSDGRLIRRIAPFLRLFVPNSLKVHHPFGGSFVYKVLSCVSVSTCPPLMLGNSRQREAESFRSHFLVWNKSYFMQFIQTICSFLLPSNLYSALSAWWRRPLKFINLTVKFRWGNFCGRQIVSMLWVILYVSYYLVSKIIETLLTYYTFKKVTLCLKPYWIYWLTT
jgi:hypothetical protein